MRAATAAEAVMAEEAVLMVEVLADVTLAMTIAMADADNIRQQITISNGLEAKPCMAVATAEASSWL